MRYLWIFIVIDYPLNSKKSKFLFYKKITDSSNNLSKWLDLLELEMLFNAEAIIKNTQKDSKNFKRL